MPIAQSQPMPMIHSWTEFVSYVGIPAAILFAVLLFVYKWLGKTLEEQRVRETEWQREAGAREERMASRITKLEDFQRTVLVDLVAETKIMLTENSKLVVTINNSVLESNTAVTTLITRMCERPCLLPDEGHAS